LQSRTIQILTSTRFLKHADRALSHAKRAGRNCVQQSQVQTNANSRAA
jgi:GGDEF domain-containing protein